MWGFRGLNDERNDIPDSRVSMKSNPEARNDGGSLGGGVKGRWGVGDRGPAYSVGFTWKSRDKLPDSF